MDFDIILLKYDTSGSLLLNKTWSKPENEVAYDLVIDNDDNVYLSGYTESVGKGRKDMLIIKYRSSGYMVWNKTWGKEYDDIATSVDLISEDTICIAGYSKENEHNYCSFRIAGFKSDGKLEWDNHWALNEGLNKKINDIAIDNSKNIYIAGSYENRYENCKSDMILMKTYEDKKESWEIKCNNENSAWGEAITLDKYGNIYIAGHTKKEYNIDYDIVVLKYDNSGINQWSSVWSKKGKDYCYGIITNSKDIYIVGSTNSKGEGDYDVLLIKNPPVNKEPIDIFLINIYFILGIVCICIIGFSLFKLIKLRKLK